MTAPSPWSKESTRLQGVDTVLAMPQRYLNARLDDLLQNATTSDGKPLADVRLSMNPGGSAWLTGKVSKLGVRVVVPGSVGTVVFTVTFSEGTMDYYDVTSDPPVKQHCDIAGLRAGFLVDLTRAGVGLTADLPEDVRNRAAALPAGSFTIEQLMMDFDNADLTSFDKRTTTFPENMSPAAVSMFADYLATYLRKLRSVGGHVLGYAITVPDWQDPVASFPPTTLGFATNQYHGDPAEPVDELVGNGALDTVNYLMMTGDAKLPDNPKPWWGNFVTPADGVGNTGYGTLAMAKNLFVDQYLLPALSPLVCGYWTLGDRKKSLEPRTTPATGVLVPTATGGTWKSARQTGQSRKTNALSNDQVTYDFNWDVSVDIPSGGDRIKVTRVVTFEIGYKHWYGVKDHAASTSYTVKYEVPLWLTITLLGAVDGRPQVSVTGATTQPAPNTLYDLPHGQYLTGTEGTSSIWANVQDLMEKTIDAAVEPAVAEALPARLADTIATTLNLSPFVFPGGAQLSMTDALFNDARDLLFGVSHNS